MRLKIKSTQNTWILNNYLIDILVGMRDQTADFRVGQNSRFWKRDKIADFDNETKPPILKWDKVTDS